MRNVIFCISFQREPLDVLDFCESIGVEVSNENNAILKYLYSYPLSNEEMQYLKIYEEQTYTGASGEFIFVNNSQTLPSPHGAVYLFEFVLIYEIYYSMLNCNSEFIDLHFALYMDERGLGKFCENFYEKLQIFMGLHFDDIEIFCRQDKAFGIISTANNTEVRVDILSLEDRLLAGKSMVFIGFVFSEKHPFYETEATLYLYNLSLGNNSLSKIMFFDNWEVPIFEKASGLYLDVSNVNANILEGSIFDAIDFKIVSMLPENRSC